VPPWSRDHGVDIHAELLGRGARRNNPQFQTGMITLEFGKGAGSASASRKSARPIPAASARPMRVAQTLRHSCQSIERRTDLGEQIRPRLGRRCVAAGAPKQPGASPNLEQAHLSADSTMGNAELRSGVRKAAEPGGGFESFDRV
jgi:hypothetical protein